MKSLILVLCLLPCTLSSNTGKEKEFISNLRQFCGKSYTGKTVFPEAEKDPFKGQELKIFFEYCSETTIRIPFHVGEDKSRTWVLTLDEKGLLLKHDHRHEDGTPDEITMYGGYAKAGSNALEQYFPADEYTANLIPVAATNEWTLMLSKDKKTLSYILKRDDKMRFRADFDLSKPRE